MAPRRLESSQRQMCETYPPTLVYPMGDPLLCAVGEVKEETFQQVHQSSPAGGLASMVSEFLSLPLPQVSTTIGTVA